MSDSHILLFIEAAAAFDAEFEFGSVIRSALRTFHKNHSLKAGKLQKLGYILIISFLLVIFKSFGKDCAKSAKSEGLFVYIHSGGIMRKRYSV